MYDKVCFFVCCKNAFSKFIFTKKKDFSKIKELSEVFCRQEYYGEIMLVSWVIKNCQQSEFKTKIIIFLCVVKMHKFHVILTEKYPIFLGCEKDQRFES